MSYKIGGRNKTTSKAPNPAAIRAGKRIGVAAVEKYGTITAAAEKMKVSFWTLYRVSRGESAPTADFIAASARHFDLSIEWLMR